MEKIKNVDQVPVEWNPEYSVGVPELDKHHKRLISFYNDAIKNCSGKKNDEREYFDNKIEVFLNHLAKHYKAEEKLLSVVNYPHYDEHKLAHTKLLEIIKFFKEEIQNNKWEINLLIFTRTLKEWFINHLNNYDLTAGEYFKEAYISRDKSKKRDVSEKESIKRNRRTASGL